MEDKIGKERERILMQHIVIVEDDFVQIKMLRMILSQEDYHLSIYSHPQEFLEHLPDMQAHLFLLDLALPSMDGFALCQHIRTIEKFYDTPIIAISADITVSIEDRDKLSEFNQLIEKPINIKKFLEIIRGYLTPA